MVIVDKTQIERDYAIVDMIRGNQDVVGLAAICQLEVTERNIIYRFLKQYEDEHFEPEPQFDTREEDAGLR